jgi:hypothetical protein
LLALFYTDDLYSHSVSDDVTCTRLKDSQGT